MTDPIHAKKAVVVAQRRTERAAREEVLAAYRRCFWRWPWGHQWQHVGVRWEWVCAVCGQSKWVGP